MVPVLRPTLGKGIVYREPADLEEAPFREPHFSPPHEPFDEGRDDPPADHSGDPADHQQHLPPALGAGERGVDLLQLGFDPGEPVVHGVVTPLPIVQDLFQLPLQPPESPVEPGFAGHLYAPRPTITWRHFSPADRKHDTPSGISRIAVHVEPSRVA